MPASKRTGSGYSSSSDEDEDETAEELIDCEALIQSVLTATTSPENVFAYMAENDERLQRAFEALDVSGAGYVEVEKLREILTTQGEKMTHKEVGDLRS